MVYPRGFEPLTFCSRGRPSCLIPSLQKGYFQKKIQLEHQEHAPWGRPSWQLISSSSASSQASDSEPVLIILALRASMSISHETDLPCKTSFLISTPQAPF